MIAIYFIGLIAVWFLAISWIDSWEDRPRYCKKHKMYQTEHRWDNKLWCDSCYNEDRQLRKRFE